MLLVLDTNIYIFGFGLSTKPSCEQLLDALISTSSLCSIRIPRLIVEEVRRNLAPEYFKEFISFVTDIVYVDEDLVVPFELGSKYEFMGLKPADAFIAAYTEWVGADALVTENRHFLSQNPNLPFPSSMRKCNTWRNSLIAGTLGGYEKRIQAHQFSGEG